MPYTETFSRVTLAVGIMPLFLGINAVLRPGSALEMMKLPAAATSTSADAAAERRTTEAIMRMYGSRNICMGLSALAVWWFGDRRTLGWVMLAGVPVAVIDGFAQRVVVPGMEWGHWAAAPVAVGLAGGLLGWY